MRREIFFLPDNHDESRWGKYSNFTCAYVLKRVAQPSSISVESYISWDAEPSPRNSYDHDSYISCRGSIVDFESHRFREGEHLNMVDQIWANNVMTRVHFPHKLNVENVDTRRPIGSLYFFISLVFTVHVGNRYIHRSSRLFKENGLNKLFGAQLINYD